MSEQTMPKFMLNICYGHNPDFRDEKDGPFIMQKYAEWSEKIRGRTVLAHKLFDGEGRTLENQKGRLVDGPYTETKESIGGFYIIHAKDYDEAVKIANECPTLLFQGGTVEVRRVEI